MLQWCCRQQRTAARLQGSTTPAIYVESDSDNNDVNSPESNASVHLYMPVDQDNVDLTGDDTWQNVTLEPSRHSAPVEHAAYVQLQYMPQHSQSRRWHVFTDSSDNSDVDEPLVDLGHVFVPAQSAMSASSVAVSENFPASTCSDSYFRLERVEHVASSSKNNDSDFRQQTAGTSV